METRELKKGDRIRVKIATRNGWIRGWRVVTGRCLGQVTIQAQGTRDFMVRDEEILEISVLRADMTDAEKIGRIGKLAKGERVMRWIFEKDSGAIFARRKGDSNEPGTGAIIACGVSEKDAALICAAPALLAAAKEAYTLLVPIVEKGVDKKTQSVFLLLADAIAKAEEVK